MTGVEADADDAVGGGDGEASDPWLEAGFCATGSPASRCAMLPRGEDIEKNGEVELEAADEAGQASRAPGDEAEESPGETDKTGGDDRPVSGGPFAAALEGADKGASNAEYHETVPRLVSFCAACCAAALSIGAEVKKDERRDEELLRVCLLASTEDRAMTGEPAADEEEERTPVAVTSAGDGAEPLALAGVEDERRDPAVLARRRRCFCMSEAGRAPVSLLLTMLLVGEELRKDCPEKDETETDEVDEGAPESLEKRIAAKAGDEMKSDIASSMLTSGVSGVLVTGVPLDVELE